MDAAELRHANENYSEISNQSEWWSSKNLQVNTREGVEKRWQEYTEELYKKDLHDPDNHDGVITHLEPDILKWEVSQALGSTTTNKGIGEDRIPAELFKS